MSDKIEYIINDFYNGKNAQDLGYRHGLLEAVNDFLFIKIILSRSQNLLEVRKIINKHGEVETQIIEPNQWVYAFKIGKRVIVITKPLPFNRTAEEANHRFRKKHNNF
jgi:hypothetical protein